MALNRRSLLKGIAAFSLFGGATAFWRSMANPYYSGPPSDHFDGTRFFDPHGSAPKSLFEVLRWQMRTERGAEWPLSIPLLPVGEPVPRVTGGGLRVTMIGHACLLIQTEGLNILTDPVFSERASPFGFIGPRRATPPALTIDALPPIDVVLVTHNHYDHLDGESLRALHEKFSPKFITPLGNDTIMRSYEKSLKIAVMDWGDILALSGEVSLHALPSRHWSARGVFDRNKALWAAFVLTTPNGHIYHIGDTGYGDGQHFRAAKARFGGFRLANIPIGAYEPRWFMSDQHVNPHEAVQIMRDCGAAQALGHHWGCFQLTDEAIDAPGQDLALALSAAEIAPERFIALKAGQIWQA